MRGEDGTGAALRKNEFLTFSLCRGSRGRAPAWVRGATGEGPLEKGLGSSRESIRDSSSRSAATVPVLADRRSRRQILNSCEQACERPGTKRIELSMKRYTHT